MKRTLLESLVFIVVLYFIFHVWPPNRKDENISRDVIKIKPRAAVVDTHSDTLIKIVDNETWLPSVDIGDDTSFAIDIPKLKKGNINVQYFAAFTPGYYTKDGKPDYLKSNSRLLSLINAMYWTEHKNPQQIGLVSTVEDIRRLADEGKISAVLAIEGAYSLEEGTGKELLRQYSDLGVRIIGLTWNYSNVLGEGADCVYMDGTPSKEGLTEWGKEIVREMNRLGIMIDVSHMNERTFWDVLNVSNKPVIASHSGAYALRKHTRNLKDEQIRAIAQKGGTVQVVFYPGFLSTSGNEAGVGTIVDHIEHIIKIAGIGHVGIGSDFDGAKMPKGLENASMLPSLVKELRERGYNEEEIQKIMGENVMRVMEETWENSALGNNTPRTPNIRPHIAMGQGVDGTMPVLSAEVRAATEGSGIDMQSLKVIIDGKAYTPKYNHETGIVSLNVGEPLREKFHVVTFYAADKDKGFKRETGIFYVR